MRTLRLNPTFTPKSKLSPTFMLISLLSLTFTPRLPLRLTFTLMLQLFLMFTLLLHLLQLPLPMFTPLLHLHLLLHLSKLLPTQPLLRSPMPDIPDTLLDTPTPTELMPAPTLPILMLLL